MYIRCAEKGARLMLFLWMKSAASRSRSRTEIITIVLWTARWKNTLVYCKHLLMYQSQDSFCIIAVYLYTVSVLMVLIQLIWKFNKLLETFLGDFAQYCHDIITQVLLIHDANLPFQLIPKLLYWTEIWRPFEFSELTVVIKTPV